MRNNNANLRWSPYDEPSSGIGTGANTNASDISFSDAGDSPISQTSQSTPETGPSLAIDPRGLWSTVTAGEEGEGEDPRVASLRDSAPLSPNTARDGSHVAYPNVFESLRAPRPRQVGQVWSTAPAGVQTTRPVARRRRRRATLMIQEALQRDEHPDPRPASQSRQRPQRVAARYLGHEPWHMPPSAIPEASDGLFLSNGVLNGSSSGVPYRNPDIMPTVLHPRVYGALADRPRPEPSDATPPIEDMQNLRLTGHSSSQNNNNNNNNNNNSNNPLSHPQPAPAPQFPDQYRPEPPFNEVQELQLEEQSAPQQMYTRELPWPVNEQRPLGLEANRRLLSPHFR